jgi:hypothetical protein
MRQSLRALVSGAVIPNDIGKRVQHFCQIARRQFNIQPAFAAGDKNRGEFCEGASINVGKRFFCPSGLIPPTR